MAARSTYEQLEQKIRKLEKNEKRLRNIEKQYRDSQTQLNALRELFKVVVENTKAHIARFDRGFRHLELNSSGMKGANLPSDGFAGKSHRELGLHEDLCDLWEENLRHVFETGERKKIEAEVNLPGRNLCLELSLNPEFAPDGSVQSVIGISHDLTQQKAIDREEQKFAAFFESIPMGAVLTYHSSTPFVVNQFFCDLLGYSKEELQTQGAYKTGKKISQPDDQKIEGEYVKQMISGNIPHYRMEKRFIKKNGEMVSCDVTASFVRDDEGRIILGISAVQDITERKRLERSLRFAAMIQDQVSDILTVTDMEGKILFVNPACEKMLKTKKENLIGKRVNVFGEDPEYGATQNEILQKTLLNQNWQGEVVNADADGNQHILYCRTFILKDDKNNPIGMCGVSTDITEKKKLERQLRQAHKMESIGTLTGGIAHDFNNILGIVMGNCELAKIHMPKSCQAKTHIGQIKEACTRARNIIRQLLDFSRDTDQTKYLSMPGPIIEEAVNLLKEMAPANIEIRQNHHDGSYMALMNPTQINQLIINLYTNAVDAMSENGGILEVNSETISANEFDRENHLGLNSGRYIKLSISDTGAGIAPEHLDRIFDPYFTTKEIGKGTGLGLSVVHGIVKSHNGFIFVESHPHRGTTFTIFFPVVCDETGFDQ